MANVVDRQPVALHGTCNSVLVRDDGEGSFVAGFGIEDLLPLELGVLRH